MEPVRYLVCGDSAISVEFGNIISEEINRKIRAFQLTLRQAGLPGVVESVPTYRSVFVVYRPEIIRFAELTGRLDEVLRKAETIELPPAEVVELPVLYGGEEGPDLLSVAEHCGLTPKEVVRIHSSRDYLIYMLGFIAGFPYLGGMDERIAAPRLANPRVRIEDGSVGIAGNQTGIYPVASPGGWRLIGRTPVKLYDAGRKPPVLLEAGQYVRFRPVGREEYLAIEAQAAAGTYRCAVYRKDADRPAGNIGGDLRLAADARGDSRFAADASGGARHAGNVRGSARPAAEMRGFGQPAGNTYDCPAAEHDAPAGIRAVSGGFLTTVQDLGRYGFQETGMAVSGVMDTRSACLANILAGNDVNEAVLEITMLGPVLEFTADNIVALTGADLGAKLDGEPFPLYQAVLVRKGQTLSFSGMVSGSRAYLACCGGFDIPAVMGSRSTNLKAGLGGLNGRKIEAGDEIRFAAPRTALPNMARRKITEHELAGSCRTGAEGPDQTGAARQNGTGAAGRNGTGAEGPDRANAAGLDTSSGVCTLRVVMGPQDDCFTERGIETFLNSVYTITNEYDRMGCRMEGERIEHKNGGDIITDGIGFGAVQVPSHGQPIVMMADHQTTGGYTKIACVISVDLPILAQCRPGTKVRFRNVRVEEAQELLCRQQAWFSELQRKLNAESADFPPGKTTYRIVLNGTEYAVELERETPRFR